MKYPLKAIRTQNS